MRVRIAAEKWVATKVRRKYPLQATLLQTAAAKRLCLRLRLAA